MEPLPPLPRRKRRRPPPDEIEPKRSPYDERAKLSIIAPLVAIALQLCVMPIVRDIGLLGFAVGMASLALWVTGLVSGVVALFAPERHCNRGLYVKAILGLTIGSLPIVFFAMVITLAVLIGERQRLQKSAAATNPESQPTAASETRSVKSTASNTRPKLPSTGPRTNSEAAAGNQNSKLSSEKSSTAPQGTSVLNSMNSDVSNSSKPASGSTHPKTVKQPDATNSSTATGSSTRSNQFKRGVPQPAPIGSSKSQTETDLVGGPGGNAFRQVRTGKPVIGFIHRTGTYRGARGVAGVTALFSESDPTFNQAQTLAPPGYAVSGLNVEAGQYVTALQVICMKVKSDGTLDPEQKSTSEWIGYPTGTNVITLDGHGKRVMGFYGRRLTLIDAVGLIFE